MFSGRPSSRGLFSPPLWHYVRSRETTVSTKRRADLSFSVRHPLSPAPSSALAIFSESQKTESKTAAAASTRAGDVAERRHGLVPLLAWSRVLHHPRQVAGLRSARPRRHASGDELESLNTLPAAALTYWSCLIPVTATPWGARIAGFHHANLSHDTHAHTPPLFGFNIYHFVPDQLSRF